MRVLDGEQILVRILIGEDDRFQERPLVIALLERLRHEGFAGATVLRGTAGYGASSVLHSQAGGSRVVEGLPLVIEVVDSQEQIDRLIPICDEMVREGLVTMEKVRVLKYAGRPKLHDLHSGPGHRLAGH